MADITMCRGTDCSLKDKCYRHKAPVNEYGQAYFFSSPFDGENCEYYWEIKK